MRYIVDALYTLHVVYNVCNKYTKNNILIDY